ncbi:MAG: hypothetical protein NW220_06095 [Leptolyngbyaceae cyanobacterium bins.349]|nr:hypothetical protein [Leptolyngbyaceae cyanobacterium bins.349]
MNPQTGEDELRRRERELAERERSLRLRELEAELNQPPLLPTTKHDRPARSQRQRGLIKAAKFIGLMVVAAVVVNIVLRVASFLATFAMVGLVAWVLYKLFFEGDRSS